MKVFISELHYDKNPNLYKKCILGFLSVLSIPYGVITSIRNFMYDKGLLKTFKPNVLTISVGNLTTGGVGKTPFTAELANFYTERGKKVGILSRGYGGSLQNKEVNVISDGEKIYFSAKESGDEPFWLSQNCKGALVFTCSSRVKASKLAVEKYGCEVLIADDSFQHRKLGRDINLMLVNEGTKFGNEKLLPAGPLRESLKGIKRATEIIVTNKSYDDENALKYCEELEKTYKKPVYLCKMIPDVCINIKNNDDILPKMVSTVAFCAIGQPEDFFNFIKKDYNLLDKKVFSDHHSYTQKDVEDIIDFAELNGVTNIITTEKDGVKIKDIISSMKTSVKIYAIKLKAFADMEKITDVR